LGADRDTPKKTTDKTARSKKANEGRDMGSALRSVYQKTVDEPVPDEMMDLLGKLG
jgi:hypothetical protein